MKMNFIRVLLSYILLLYLNPVASQQYHYYNEAPQQYDEANDNGDSNEFSDDQNKRLPIRRSRFTESEECYCTCERCFDGREKPCCDEFCRYCAPPQDMPMGNINQYDAFPPAEQKVVFVPFPYPLIVPDEITTPPLTTLANTRTTPRPTTTTPKPTTATAKPSTTTLKTTTTTPKPTTTKPKPTTTTPKPTTTTPKPTTTTHKPTTTTPKHTTKTTTKAKAKTTTKTKMTKKRHTTKKGGFRRLANDLEYDILTRHRQLMKMNPVLKRHRPTWVPRYGIVPNPYQINQLQN